MERLGEVVSYGCIPEGFGGSIGGHRVTFPAGNHGAVKTFKEKRCPQLIPYCMTHRVKLVVSASHFSEVASGARNVSHTPKHRIGIRLYMTLVVGLCAAMGYVLTPVVVNPSGVHSPVRPSTPRATVHAKVVGAALLAAFASKSGKSDSKVEDDLSLEAKQRAVVESIQTVLAAASSWKPRETFSALGEFGQASGGLATLAHA